MGSNTELLEDLVRRHEETIADLRRTIVDKDAQIRELLSQLDKYRSVLKLTGGPAGALLLSTQAEAPTTVGARKLHRAWGISAEPQSSLTGGRVDLTHPNLVQSSQKYFKDQRWARVTEKFLPLDEAIASRAVFVMVSGLDGRAGGNAFGTS